MHQLISLRPKDIQRINDQLHLALTILEDFKWGNWWLRCIELNFGKGHYKTGDNFTWHMHKEFQFEIPVGGKFLFNARHHGAVHIQTGDSYIIPPDAVHRWECKRQGMMIGLLLTIIPQVGSGLAPDFHRIAPEKISSPDMEKLLTHLIDELLSATRFKDFSQKRIACWMHLLITSILCESRIPALIQDEIPSTGETYSRNQRVISKLMRFIDANLAGDLSIPRFVEEFGFSARQIHRLFISVTGISCHHYVMNRRLEYARSTLQAHPMLSIKEVAHAAGFSSTAHFSSRFKKCFKISPSDFRMQRSIIPPNEDTPPLLHR